MCPTCIVLTDSHYVPATDTLTGIDCKSTIFFKIAQKKIHFFVLIPPRVIANTVVGRADAIAAREWCAVG